MTKSLSGIEYRIIVLTFINGGYMPARDTPILAFFGLHNWIVKRMIARDLLTESSVRGEYLITTDGFLALADDLENHTGNAIFL